MGYLSRNKPQRLHAQLAIAKNDAYRQMLHDVKAAFTAFNNGPVLHAIGHYLRMTDTSMQHVKSSTGTLKEFHTVELPR